MGTNSMRPYFRGRLAAVAVAVVALAALAAAAPANAGPVATGGELGQRSEPKLLSGQTCAGTLIEHLAIKDGSTTLAWLDVYWDGTYNCAETVSSNVTWGVRKEMGVAILSCVTSDARDSVCDGPPAEKDNDMGDFQYYAGPAKVDGRKVCIGASGWIKWNGTLHSADSPGWGHCG